jgi:hypothetical protein
MPEQQNFTSKTGNDRERAEGDPPQQKSCQTQKGDNRGPGISPEFGQPEYPTPNPGWEFKKKEQPGKKAQDPKNCRDGLNSCQLTFLFKTRTGFSGSRFSSCNSRKA